MGADDVQVILIQLAELRATVTTQLANIATDNQRGETVHSDHEARLRSLEAVRWKIAGWAAALGAIGGGGVVAALSRLTGGV